MHEKRSSAILNPILGLHLGNIHSKIGQQDFLERAKVFRVMNFILKDPKIALLLPLKNGCFIITTKPTAAAADWHPPRAYNELRPSGLTAFLFA